MRKAGEEWKRSGHQSAPTSEGLSRDYRGVSQRGGRSQTKQENYIRTVLAVFTLASVGLRDQSMKTYKNNIPVVWTHSIIISVTQLFHT